MEDNASVIYAWVTLFYVVNRPICLMIYYRRRHLDPIRRLNPGICLLAATFGTLHCVTWSSSLVFEDSIPCVYPVILGTAAIILDIDCFLLLVWYLFLAFNRSRAALEMSHNKTTGSDDDSDDDRKKALKTIHGINAMMTRKRVMLFLMGNLALYLFLCTLATIVHPEAFDTPLSKQNDVTRWRMLVAFAGLVLMVPAGLAIIGFSVALRLVHDRVGIKSMLKSVGIATFFSITGLVIIENVLKVDQSMLGGLDPSRIFVFVVEQIAFTIVILNPIRRSYNRRAVRVAALDYNNILHRFLLIDENFKSFQTYLLGEYSVENVLFWQEVQEYKDMYSKLGREAPAIPKKAQQIFEAFVDTNAELMINIPSKERDDIIELYNKEGGPGALLQPNTFDDAVKNVLMMMKADSLHRYIKVNKEVWENFTDGETERTMMDTLCSHIAGGTNSSDRSRTTSRIETSARNPSRFQPDTAISVLPE